MEFVDLSLSLSLSFSLPLFLPLSLSFSLSLSLSLSSNKEIIPLAYQLSQTPLGECSAVMFTSPQEKDITKLEAVQCRATKMMPYEINFAKRGWHNLTFRIYGKLFSVSKFPRIHECWCE